MIFIVQGWCTNTVFKLDFSIFHFSYLEDFKGCGFINGHVNLLIAGKTSLSLYRALYWCFANKKAEFNYIWGLETKLVFLSWLDWFWVQNVQQDYGRITALIFREGVVGAFFHSCSWNQIHDCKINKIFFLELHHLRITIFPLTTSCNVTSLCMKAMTSLLLWNVSFWDYEILRAFYRLLNNSVTLKMCCIITQNKKCVSSPCSLE